MSRVLFRLVVVFLVLAAATQGVLRAELTPDQAKQARALQARALIEQFSAKEFAVRQAAVEKLIALGPDVVPLVRKTLTETKDAEVKLRCEMTLRGIAQKFGADAIAEKPAARTDTKTPINLEASKITIDVKDAPLDEVMQKFAEQSGNQPIDVPENLRDKTVTLSVRNTPYWQAMDKVCELAGVMYMPVWAQRKLQLLEAGETPRVGCYAGPVVMKVEEGTNSRSFRKMKVPGGGRPVAIAARDDLTYQLSCFWEDRLPNARVELRVTKAITPDGRNLIVPEQPGLLVPLVDPMHFGKDKETSHRLGMVRIREVPEGLKMLAEISGVLRLKLGIGEKVVKVEDVLVGGAREPVTEDGVTITVKKAERQDNRVTVDIEARCEGGQGLASFAPESAQCAFFLVDPNGVRHPCWMKGGSFGPRAAAGPGRAAREEAQLNLMFQNLPVIDGAWALLFTYPERTESREYPFTIKDVPVP